MDSAGSLADRDANELHPGCPPTVAPAPVLRRVHTADTGWVFPACGGAVLGFAGCAALVSTHLIPGAPLPQTESQQPKLSPKTVKHPRRAGRGGGGGVTEKHRAPRLGKTDKAHDRCWREGPRS